MSQSGLLKHVSTTQGKLPLNFLMDGHGKTVNVSKIPWKCLTVLNFEIFSCTQYSFCSKLYKILDFLQKLYFV